MDLPLISCEWVFLSFNIFKTKHKNVCVSTNLESSGSPTLQEREETSAVVGNSWAFTQYLGFHPVHFLIYLFNSPCVRELESEPGNSNSNNVQLLDTFVHLYLNSNMQMLPT